jgi:hypothetical protein
MTDERDEQQEANPDRERESAGIVDSGTLSDLFVNAVPILIIGALLVGFQLLSSGSGGEPLLAMHLALVGGVVLVSYVAARAVTSADGELAGPNGPGGDDRK